MEIRSKDDSAPIVTPHGETVHELIGPAAGNASAQHSLALIELPPGKASLPHYHPVAEESYFILKGRARMVVDGESRPLAAGQSVLIHPRQKHQIFNESDEPVQFMAVCVPPWTPECSVFL